MSSRWCNWGLCVYQCQVSFHFQTSWCLWTLMLQTSHEGDVLLKSVLIFSGRQPGPGHQQRGGGGSDWGCRVYCKDPDQKPPVLWAAAPAARIGAQLQEVRGVRPSSWIHGESILLFLLWLQTNNVSFHELNLGWVFQVRMGNKNFSLGKVQYDTLSQATFPLEAQIGVGVGASIVALIVLIIVLIYRSVFAVLCHGRDY